MKMQRVLPTILYILLGLGLLIWYQIDQYTGIHTGEVSESYWIGQDQEVFGLIWYDNDYYYRGRFELDWIIKNENKALVTRVYHCHWLDYCSTLPWYPPSPYRQIIHLAQFLFIIIITGTVAFIIGWVLFYRALIKS